jgi:hypothetical protein
MKRARSRYELWWPVLALLAVSGCSSHDDSDKNAATEPMTPSNGAGARAGATGSAGSGANGTATGTGTITSPADVPKELTISGPVPAGMKKPFTATSADLPAFGYSEKEFFIEGGATAYTLPGGMTMDGKWTLMEASKAAFKTRLIVRRPIDASKFNGTVVVEWLNVSGGADGDPGFMYNSDLILREGYAYVGVSAQAVGVMGGGFSLGGAGAVPLVMYDPERYGTLKHPGDAYSFDIFSQAGQAIRTPGKADVLEGLKPQRLIAYGESQSAMRMVSYVNGVHPLVHRYDGFFIHSRGASGVPFEEAAGGISLGGFGGGGAALIRDDIEEKVFQFQTETDVTGMLAFLPARQPDTEKLRTWEVAGTAHADQFILDFNASMATEGAIQCAGANTGPQYRVIRAGLHSLNVWMTDGPEPARGAVLSTDASGKSMKDENGNSIGGVRSPDVDVPTKMLSGDPAASGGGSLFCFLFGSTTPFTADQLMKLYPTHDAYVTKVKESAGKLRQAGFLLEPEESGFVADAQKAPVPN